MKRILTICVLLLLISCSKNSDSFSDIEFGKISETKFINLMKSEKVLIPDSKDTTYLRYFLNVRGKKIPTLVYINEINWNYNFGKLRKIELDVGTDKSENNYDCKGCGPISKEDVDLIYNFYVEQYGKPDSLVEKNKYRYSPMELAYEIMSNKPLPNNPSKLDRSIPKSKKAIWFKKNFKLTIDIPHPIKNESKGGKFYYNMSHDSYVSINYEMINYKNEIKRIQDSIRILLKPNDILELSVYNPKWVKLNAYTTRFELDLLDLKRKDFEEPRSIKGFKYDIVLTDSFNEELYRFDNIRTYDIDNSANYINIGTGQILQMNFYVDYNNFSKAGEKLESIRNYMNTNPVKIKADIKKILFEDNTILQ